MSMIDSTYKLTNEHSETFGFTAIVKVTAARGNYLSTAADKLVMACQIFTRFITNDSQMNPGA